MFVWTSNRSARGASLRGQYPPSPQPDRRSFERLSDTGKMRDRSGSRSSPNNFYLDSLDASMRPSRLSVDYHDSFSEDSSSMGRRSMDLPDSMEYLSSSTETPGDSSPTAAVSSYIFCCISFILYNIFEQHGNSLIQINLRCNFLFLRRLF